MRIIETIIAEIRPNCYKAIIWGQHDEHIMDWNGCNYRYMVIKGQPRKGFPCQESLRLWWDSQSIKLQQSELDRASFISGTHIGPYAEYPKFGNALTYKKGFCHER